MVDRLAQALRDRLEVAAREAAVGREALGEDQEVAALLGELVVVQRQPAADVRQRRPSWRSSSSRRRATPSRARCPRTSRSPGPSSRSPDEPGVLGEAARVEEERDAVCGRRPRARPRTFASETGWPPPELFVIVTKHDRDASAPRSASSALERVDVHVPLERVQRAGSRALGDRQVDRLAPRWPRRWRGWCRSGCCSGRSCPGRRSTREQDLLRGPPLVGRDDVLEREQLLHRCRGSGTTTATRRSSRRRAGSPPTGRATSRPCRSRSAGR